MLSVIPRFSDFKSGLWSYLCKEVAGRRYGRSVCHHVLSVSLDALKIYFLYVGRQISLTCVGLSTSMATQTTMS